MTILCPEGRQILISCFDSDQIEGRLEVDLRENMTSFGLSQYVLDDWEGSTICFSDPIDGSIIHTKTQRRILLREFGER